MSQSNLFSPAFVELGRNPQLLRGHLTRLFPTLTDALEKIHRDASSYIPAMFEGIDKARNEMLAIESKQNRTDNDMARLTELNIGYCLGRIMLRCFIITDDMISNLAYGCNSRKVICCASAFRGILEAAAILASLKIKCPWSSSTVVKFDKLTEYLAEINRIAESSTINWPLVREKGRISTIKAQTYTRPREEQLVKISEKVGLLDKEMSTLPSPAPEGYFMFMYVVACDLVHPSGMVETIRQEEGDDAKFLHWACQFLDATVRVCAYVQITHHQLLKQGWQREMTEAEIRAAVPPS